MTDQPPSAIVTGAASGLGRAIAVRLACDGWRVALADINDAGNQETRRLVEQAGGQARLEQLDVTRVQDWEIVRDRLTRDWQQLDLVVNNAGRGGSGEVGRFALDDWESLLRVNLLGTIYGCHTFVDWLKQNPRGAHLINIASLAGLIAPPTIAAYNVSKAGVVALSETLYIELKPHGVGVTVVCPTFFRTHLLDRWKFETEVQKQIAHQLTSETRFSADDVADSAIRAMHEKRFYVVMAARARWFWRLKRLMPERFLKVIAREFERRKEKL